MTRVTFIGRDTTRTVDAPDDARLLDVAQADGQPLEGTCDGDMACATCHVHVDPADFPRLPPASGDEEDLLDLAHNATRFSRLACQIRVTPDLATLTVRIP